MQKCRAGFVRNGVIAGLLAAIWLGPARAEVTTIAYDGIDYTAGQLMQGENGGTGWLGAWRFDYTYGENFRVTGTGLTYTGLTTTGGAMTWTSGGNGISANDRALPVQNSGVVYVQFLSDFGSVSALGTPQVRLLYEGEYVAGFGANGGEYMAILGGDLTPIDGSSSTAPIGQLNLVIARIDYTAVKTDMWVNPDLSLFDYDAPGAADATYGGLAPTFDRIGAYTRNPGTVDEIRVMQVVPEPTAGMLILLGGAGLLARRVLRRRGGRN